MKKSITFFTVLFLLFSSIIYGQEKKDKSYRFVNPEIVNNLQDYENAFSTADMTKFRFVSKSNVIEFESGLKVELLSGDKLVANGFTVDKTKMLQNQPANKGYYVFGLSANGNYIIQKFTYTKLK